MNARALLVILAGFAVAACAPSSSPYLQKDAAERASKQFPKEYGAYAIEALPDEFAGQVRSANLKAKSQPLVSLKSLSLKLQLGARWSVASNSVFRTESRYRLCDGAGRVLAAAESTLSEEDLSQGGGLDIFVLSDPESLSFLLAEEQSWSVRRYILIRPAADAEYAADGTPNAWEVRYVSVPERDNGVGLYAMSELLGLWQGKLYFRQDGRLYAIPLERLPVVENLSFAVG